MTDFRLTDFVERNDGLFASESNSDPKQTLAWFCWAKSRTKIFFTVTCFSIDEQLFDWIEQGFALRVWRKFRSTEIWIKIESSATRLNPKGKKLKIVHVNHENSSKQNYKMTNRIKCDFCHRQSFIRKDFKIDQLSEVLKWTKLWSLKGKTMSWNEWFGLGMTVFSRLVVKNSIWGCYFFQSLGSHSGLHYNNKKD